MKLNFPPVIFGTSSLGNLFTALDEDAKFDIVKACVQHAGQQAVFDCAGKYGAGLALEVLGKCLKRLAVPAENVVISNKLAWVRAPLFTDEPTFEPGVWKGLKYDAVQKISYDGILECYEQGNDLLDGYVTQMVSVHDPDEYLAAAHSAGEAERRYNEILAAYEALHLLKQKGKVNAIGIGAKDWTVIRRIAGDVQLDWVMIANSLTIKNHPEELLKFVHKLNERGTTVINSAVFHSGFLVGGDYFDYKLVKPGVRDNDLLYRWRQQFFDICKTWKVAPAAACVKFALNVPGVTSVALSTTDAGRVKENLALANADIPGGFWEALKFKGLISTDFLRVPQAAAV